jgi:5'-phosphate synthase pdxT subunit
MINVGVLALQGGVKEHIKLLNHLSEVTAIPIKKSKQLKKIDGLILPGGESTTIGKLINIFDLKEEIIKLAKSGVPIWGTCAGMILLAKKIINEKEQQNHLNLMNITVKRNAYGNQLNSFKTRTKIPKISNEKLPLVFIRAPYVVDFDPQVEILLELKNKIVAVEENNLLATSFHPELDQNLKIHQYFIDKIKRNVKNI